MPLTQTKSPPMLHIRVEGQSRDVPFVYLDLGETSSTNEVKRAVARYLGLPEAQLADYVVDRHETGNWTIRPAAVFG